MRTPFALWIVLLTLPQILLGCIDRHPAHGEGERWKGKEGLFARDTALRLGNIPERTVVETRTWLYNAGASPRGFTVDSPDCPCLRIRPAQGRIAPGDSLCLHVQFNSAGQWGDNAQLITVREQPDEGQSVTILVEATVESELVFTPVRAQP